MSTFHPGEALRWQIGDVRVTRVGELVAPTPWEMLLPSVTDAHVAETHPWMAPYMTDGGLMLLSFHTFVVESAGATIVVDTCLGDDPVRVMPGDPTFPDRLAEEIDGGLGGVDIVLCTHLHFDHVGWNTRVVDGERFPTFPNARYLFAQAELDQLDADDPHDVREADVEAILSAGLADIVDSPHQLTPEVRTTPTPGHSPGHVSLLIESAGDRAVITGDAFHSPIQFRHPDIAATPFDWDAAMSTTTRRRLIEDWTDADVLVLGTHFAPPTAGHVRNTPDGITFS